VTATGGLKVSLIRYVFAFCNARHAGDDQMHLVG
jgi:hypothetical protein